jgi:3-phosphoshikimate 1-carboxyvinyltransferase
MKIRPATAVRGDIALPGDKSISHRAAMISAIASGPSRISNFAGSADCESTLACLETLGVDIQRNGSEITIQGKGKYGFIAPSVPLDCGNSGTTMRLLAGFLAGQPFASTMIGDESLSSRPMGRVIEPLGSMGCRIDSSNGTAPLRILGSRPLSAIEYGMPVSSAQIKSCVLLAGLFADGITEVTERTTTRDHTERMLRRFGARITETVSESGKTIAIDGSSELNAAEIRVPGDISGAAFFAAAAAGLPGSHVTIKNVGINPTRTAFLNVLEPFGVNFSVSDTDDRSGEPVGTLNVYGDAFESVDAPILIDGADIPNLIDEIPILAVLGTRLPGGLEVRDAAELRVKESDRIAAVTENLKRMGAHVEEFDDGFRIYHSELKGAEIESFGDHRIAMAFAVAGLFASGETNILRPECVAISFPDFFEQLEKTVSR